MIIIMIDFDLPDPMGLNKKFLLQLFLVATKQLYKSVCPSVGPSVRRSVGMYVMLSLFGLLGATYAVFTTLF